MKYYKEIGGETVFFTGNVLRTSEYEILNPTEELMLEAGWNVYIIPEPTEEQLLTDAKQEKIREIEDYDASDAVELFTINGISMWLGHELRQQIRTSADAYEATGATEMAKIFNGLEFTFNIDTWRQMLNVLEVYAAEALNTTERHKTNIEALTNIEDVINYNYTVDYPQKLNFNT